MSATLTIDSKTYNSISGHLKKTDGILAVLIISPGFDRDTIFNNWGSYEQQHPDTRAVKMLGEYDADWSFNSSVDGLEPNTQYSVFLWHADSSYDQPPKDGTLPPPPLAAPTIQSVASESASIIFTTAADGGYYPKQIQYSLDGGNTWEIAATVAAGAPTSGVITMNDLQPNTNYVAMMRVATQAGYTDSPSVSFTTTDPHSDTRSCLYGSLNDSARPIDKFYGSVTRETKRITKFYGSVSGVTKRIY